MRILNFIKNLFGFKAEVVKPIEGCINVPYINQEFNAPRLNTFTMTIKTALKKTLPADARPNNTESIPKNNPHAFQTK